MNVSAGEHTPGENKRRVIEALSLKAPSTRVAISIATYNRPEGLGKVLEGIGALELPPSVEARVVVVDNSEDANARQHVEKLLGSYALPLSYFHETQRGISFSRNRGLLDALEQGDDYLAFIDDDEFPERDWLTVLLDAIKHSGAAVVSGGVKPCFSSKPSWWVQKGGVFEILDYPEGEPIPYAHTTNALLDLKAVKKEGIQFDPAFALTGGEDTLFFSQLRDAGYSTVFASKALVYEDIVSERATLGWLLKRWFRTGNTDGLVERKKDTGLSTATRLVAGGVLRVVVGAGGAILASPLLLLKRTPSLEFMRIACRGGGFVTSVFGVAYEEYRNHNR